MSRKFVFLISVLGYFLIVLLNYFNLNLGIGMFVIYFLIFIIVWFVCFFLWAAYDYFRYIIFFNNKKYRNALFKSGSLFVTSDSIITRNKVFRIKEIYAVFVTSKEVCIALNKEQANTFYLQHGDNFKLVPRSDVLFPFYVNLRSFNVSKFGKVLENFGFKKKKIESISWDSRVFEFKRNTEN